MRQLSIGASAHQWSAPLGRPSGALITPCGRYRTMLWRTFGIGADARPLVFVMLNPSTADADADDPTIRRCLRFADREDAGGILVVNLSPYRATDPRDLERARREGIDVVLATENYQAMKRARSFGPFVLAWGAGVRPWMDSPARVARQIGGACLCLGRTKMGEPRHPLMLSHTAKLELFANKPEAAWKRP